MRTYTDENGAVWTETVDDEGTVIRGRSHVTKSELAAIDAQTKRLNRQAKIEPMIAVIILVIGAVILCLMAPPIASWNWAAWLP